MLFLTLFVIRSFISRRQQRYPFPASGAGIHSRFKSVFFFRYFILTVSIFIISANNIRTQIVYTPSENYVYEFLERLSTKQVIEYHDEVKPLSRKQIAELLADASLKKEKLSSVELEELDWLCEEYAYELGTNPRWYLFSYTDSVFSLKVSPLAGYGISGTGKYSGHSRWWGIDVYASHSKWFGASFYAKDQGEYGSNVDKVRNFSPLTGAAYKPAPDGMEVSDIRGSISCSWDWGHVSLIKDYVEWGHGKFGQLILSEKAPPFTFIRLDLYPLKWLRFYYIHGWLNSLVYDSSSFSYNHSESIKPFLRKDYVNKYIAANFLSISPFNWMDISFGNSIVYSGKLRPEFFIPFLFFKHFDNRGVDKTVEDGNKQLYLDLLIKYPESFSFYSTLFADCIEIRKLLKNDLRGTELGYTAGAKKVDLLFPMLDLTVEYTRINPWVYEHKDETTTYKHLNYYLGHWLGQNADQFRVQLDYRPLRGLKLETYVEFIRKGRLNDIYYNYYGQQVREPFLLSPLRKEKRLSLEASYEVIHDLFGELSYSYSDVKDEDLTRTPGFLLGIKNSFAIIVHYGL